MKLKDPNSTDSFPIDFSTTDHPNPQQKHGIVASPKSKYEKLHPDDKNTVESILFLMDKFGVGDEFIHELSMAVDDFHLIVKSSPVQSSLFWQGSPISYRLVSKGALRKIKTT